MVRVARQVQVQTRAVEAVVVAVAAAGVEAAVETVEIAVVKVVVLEIAVTVAQLQIPMETPSVASAEEPSTTPFGLGERRTGDAVLSEQADADVAEGGVVVPLVLGRAMGAIGAIGRPMGPTSGAGVAVTLFELGRRPAPGARPELGGAIGAGGRGGKDISNGVRAGPSPGAEGKPGGSADGARGGGANGGPGIAKGVPAEAKPRGGPLGEKSGDGCGGGIGSCGVTGSRG